MKLMSLLLIYMRSDNLMRIKGKGHLHSGLIVDLNILYLEVWRDKRRGRE